MTSTSDAVQEAEPELIEPSVGPPRRCRRDPAGAVARFSSWFDRLRVGPGGSAGRRGLRSLVVVPAPGGRMRGDLVRFGIGAAALLLSALVARHGVPGWEERTFRWVFASPDGLERVLWLPMQLGSAWAPLLAAVLIWALVREWRPAVGCLVVGLGAWWAAKGVKAVVDRGRPASVLAQVEARAETPLDGLGYLSGHVTVAFAVVTVLAPYLTRRSRVVAYGLGVVVAAARVQVGAHLPLDVIGGAAFGTLLGATWYLLVGFRDHTSWLERRAARRAGERAATADL